MNTTKASCKNGIDSVKANAPDDSKYERKKTASGKHIFNLKDSNHQLIGTSQSYENTASSDKGIESVRTNSTN
ncbi:YegP family protein [Vibrio casei]|uniref:YegP family protein n=1 Tax=Vibrio casei TaxID=673372 RepID=UPI003F9C2590